MIAQAIVALLQQASEIDWVTVRSCFLYRAAADNSFSGFRPAPIPRGGAVGGTQVLALQPLAALSAGTPNGNPGQIRCLIAPPRRKKVAVGV
jgi:hypothetical protein